MDIKNKGYLKELERLQVELDEYKDNVKLGNTILDLKVYEKKLLDVYELKYLKSAIENGADEVVQFGILNMRIK